MLTIDSKTGIARGSQKQVYDYVTDFRNFSTLLPKEKLNDIEVREDTLSFSLQGLGNVGLIIREKIPYSKVIVGATEESTADFTFTVYMEEAGGNQCKVKFNLKANLNIFLEMMAKGALQQFADLMVDKLISLDFGEL